MIFRKKKSFEEQRQKVLKIWCGGGRREKKNSSATPDGLVQLRWSALTHRVPTSPRPCHTYCTAHTHTHTHTHTETWGNTHTHSLTEPLSTDYSPCCGESVCATASAPRSAAAADSRESSPDGGPDHSQLKKSEQLPQSARINEAGVQPHSHTPVCLFVWSDYSRLVFFPGWSFRVIRINQPRMWSTRPVCSGRVLLLLLLLLFLLLFLLFLLLFLLLLLLLSDQKRN